MKSYLMKYNVNADKMMIPPPTAAPTTTAATLMRFAK